MEDPKPPQTTTPQNDPSLPQKKPADSISHFENSKYFQMRALLKDLRPHFLEVNQTKYTQSLTVYLYSLSFCLWVFFEIYIIYCSIWSLGSLTDPSSFMDFQWCLLFSLVNLNCSFLFASAFLGFLFWCFLWSSFFVVYVYHLYCLWWMGISFHFISFILFYLFVRCICISIGSFWIFFIFISMIHSGFLGFQEFPPL